MLVVSLSTPSPLPLSALVAAAEELQRVIAQAEPSEPLPPPGEYAESWDSGETFHWSGRPKDWDGKIINIAAGSAREAAEKRAYAAVVALDRVCHAAHTLPKAAGSYRGVRVGWLKALAKTIPREWTTADVVARRIKPETAGRRCRYVELLPAVDVGEASLFTSHTWGALFANLVAAIAHVASDDAYVWRAYQPPAPSPFPAGSVRVVRCRRRPSRHVSLGSPATLCFVRSCGA